MTIILTPTEAEEALLEWAAKRFESLPIDTAILFTAPNIQLSAIVGPPPKTVAD